MSLPMTSPRTYGDLLTYTLPIRPISGSTGSSTAAYSNHDPAPQSEYLHISQPAPEDDPVTARIINGLRSFLTDAGLLDSPLPVHVSGMLESFYHTTWQVIPPVIETEDDVMQHYGALFSAVEQIIFAMTEGKFKVQVKNGERAFSQQGDRSLFTVTGEQETVFRSAALELKTPSVLLAHAEEMRQIRHYIVKPHDRSAQSMLYNLFLHAYHSAAEARVGIIFDGIHCIIAERFVQPGEQHGFSVSLLHDCFAGADGAIPFLGVLIGLLHPKVEIPELKLTKERVTTPFPNPAEEAAEEVVMWAMDIDPSSRTALTAAGAGDNPVGNAGGSAIETLSFIYEPFQPALSAPSPSSPSSNLCGMTSFSSSSSTQTSHRLLRALELIHAGPEARTWRADLDGRSVIAKVFPEKDHMLARARTEVQAINVARMMCGDVTPTVHGLYKWSDAEGALILQEDAGQGLSADFADTSAEQREMVWKIVTNLHMHGIQHGDIKGNNFVKSFDGTIRVVDFGNATLQHHCPGLNMCAELHQLRKVLGRL